MFARAKHSPLAPVWAPLSCAADGSLSCWIRTRQSVSRLACGNELMTRCEHQPSCELEPALPSCAGVSAMLVSPGQCDESTTTRWAPCQRMTSVSAGSKPGAAAAMPATAIVLACSLEVARSLAASTSLLLVFGTSANRGASIADERLQTGTTMTRSGSNSSASGSLSAAGRGVSSSSATRRLGPSAREPGLCGTPFPFPDVDMPDGGMRIGEPRSMLAASALPDAHASDAETPTATLALGRPTSLGEVGRTTL